MGNAPHTGNAAPPHGIPAASIIIPQNRQRTEINADKLSELVESIRSVGLLHPIVVRAEGDTFPLVAGERRLSAMKLLAMSNTPVRCGVQEFAPGLIPCTFLGELSPDEALEAELEENVRRVDLTVMEQSKAVARLSSLRQGTRKELVETLFPDAHEQWGSKKVREMLAIARNEGKIEGLDKAKSFTEAAKLLRRAEQQEQHRALAQTHGGSKKLGQHEVFHEDCTDWLVTAGNAGRQFDCILIDPPYGMDAELFGDGAGRVQGITHQYADTPVSFRSLMGVVAPLLGGVSKPESHLYVWCDIDGFHFLRELFAANSWWVHRTPLVNIKREGGRVPWPEHGPRRSYEMVLYAVKGKKPTNGIFRDVFESTLEGDNLGHGAQKPVEAYVELLRRSCKPGDRVLDCFAGTGTIIPAAQALNLYATAVEQDEAAYGICLKRLEGVEK